MIRQVPVIEINRENLNTFWPSIILTIRNSNFLALDVELSGLGERKWLNAKSIDDRYKNISTAASTRSVLSLGLSCFTVDDHNDHDRSSESSSSNSVARTFKNQTYNFLTLCDDDFVVESGAVRFLVEHGFDFNLQYSRGLSYRRGNQKSTATKSGEKNEMNLRGLFKELVFAKKPIVMHNGLIDLLFLYANFIADLPSTLQSFVADVAELFPAGVYDTKFVADFCARYSASYLEYVFRKCQRENESEAKVGRSSIEIRLPNFSPAIEKWVEWAACGVERNGTETKEESLCGVFAAHGCCKHGRQCPLSHDVDSILDAEESKVEKKRAKKRRRRKQNGANGSSSSVADTSQDFEDMQVEEAGARSLLESSSSTKSEDSSTVVINGMDIARSSSSSSLYSGAHRAGYDSFMTGFSLLWFSLKYAKLPQKGEEFDVSLFKNKIALSGKEYPLIIQHSAFAKMSQNVHAFLKSSE